MGGGGEDEPLGVLQHLRPVGNVADVVGPGRKLQVKVGAEERRTHLGDQLFASIAVVAPALRPKSRSSLFGL